MLRTALRVRIAAPFALATLTLGMPSVAVADTTPTPSPTTSASGAPAPTPSSTATVTPAKPAPTPTKAAPAAPSTSPSATTLKSSPFGVPQLSAKRIAGTPGEQAAYAGGFMVRTLAANGDHYNYPDSTFFDGGNTVDAILGLDGAKVGLSGADDAFAYVEDNVGGYIGSDFDSLYAGPAGKVLLGAVAHGGDVNDFGGVDLVDVLLNDSLGAAEPGRFSDLPATDCGYDVCDYSNTIGQSLALIGVGRATGEVPDVAMDFLLDQQCADGGFRGDVDATTCVSDLDATAFAAQALVGRYGTEDAATTRTLDFLAGKQSADGGLLNQDGQSNSNTVGVAAQAFAAGGYADELAKAQSFLAGLQFDCTAAPALRGGIAFTAADKVTLQKTPTDQEAYDQLLRSTPQATLGLAGGSLLDVTAEGAQSSAPVLACAGPSPTPTVSATPTVTPTVTPTTAPSTTGPGTSAPTTEPTGPTGPAGTTRPGSGPGLAYTGASIAGPLGLAAMLLLAGAATVLFARRRGAHL